MAIIGVSRKSFCCNDFFARTTDREQVNPHYCRQSAVGVDLIGHALPGGMDDDAVNDVPERASGFGGFAVGR